MTRRRSRPPRSRGARRAQVAAMVALACAVSGAAAAPPPRAKAEPATGTICDSTTALTVIGMDTEAGRVLLAVAGPGGGAGSWTVDLDSSGAAGTAGAGSDGAAAAGAVR
jgi:hypothetical protein